MTASAIRLVGARHWATGEVTTCLVEPDGQVRWHTTDADLPTLPVDGAWLTPGFLDLATQSPEPGHEVRGSLSQLVLQARRGGFTELLLWPNTQPPLDADTDIRALLQRNAELPITLRVAAAASKGLAGKHLAELHLLAAAGAAAFTDGWHPPQDLGLAMRTLQYLQGMDRPLLVMPLDLALAGKGVATESPASTRLGLKSQPALAESSMVQRLLDVLAQVGGRLHLTPITTAASLPWIRAAKDRGLSVTAGTAPQYLLWDDTALADFDSRFRFQPPLRTHADVAALRTALADGTLDTIDSHHQDRMLEDKQLEFEYAEPGCPSLPFVFSAAHQALVASGAQSLTKLFNQLVSQSRHVLGVPVPGDRADEWMLVWPERPAGAPDPLVSAAVQPYGLLSLPGQIQPVSEAVQSLRQPA